MDTDILDRLFAGSVLVTIDRYPPVEVRLHQQPLIKAVDEALRCFKGGLSLSRKTDWKEVVFDEASRPPQLSVSS